MARSRIIKIVFLCLLIILIASACSNPPQPAGSATAISESQKNPTVDIKSVLRDFLSALPADWNLVTTQDVAKTSPFIVDVRQPE